MNRIIHTILLATLAGVCLANEDTSQLEVIEVKAQKRVQNIQNVAAAITSISTDQIQLNNLQDSYQLSGLSPGLLVTENAGFGSPAAVSIRAVSLLDYNTSNTSPITFYFDEVPSGSVSNQFAELFDMQHVEVLRGPQGTLFGRNTSGGALLFFSQAPEQEKIANVTAGIGTDNYQKLQSVLNLPFDNRQAVRLSLQHLDADFTGANNLFAAPQASMRRNSGRFQYQYQDKTWTANFLLTQSDWQGISQPYGHTGVRDLQSGKQCDIERALAGACTDFFGFNDGSDNFRDVSVDNDSPHDSEQTGASLKISWNLNQDLVLTSVSGINQLDRKHQIHCDASSINVCVGFFDLDNKVISQELRLNGSYGKGEWILGAFYFDEDLTQDNSIDLLRDLRPLGESSGAAQYFYQNQIDTRSKALFYQTDYALSKKLTITAGARYSQEEIRFIGNTDLNVPVAASDATIPFWRVTDKISDNQWSGKLSLAYQKSSAHLYYVSASSGFKSGGFNGGFLFAPEEAENAGYGPETLYSYEIGSKAVIWGNTARLSINAFFYDYRDQQVFINQPSSTPNAPNLQLLQNVADADIVGLESEFEWQISSGFTLNLGASYMPDAEFGEYTDPTGAMLEGNRLPFAPEYQANANLRYLRDTPDGNQWVFTGLYRFQSEIYFDQNQNPLTRQGGYGVWDVNIHFLTQSGWRAGFNVKNVFDKEYETLRFDLIDFLGLVNSNKGEGRRIVFEFSYEFSANQ